MSQLKCNSFPIFNHKKLQPTQIYKKLTQKSSNLYDFSFPECPCTCKLLKISRYLTKIYLNEMYETPKKNPKRKVRETKQFCIFQVGEEDAQSMQLAKLDDNYAIPPLKMIKYQVEYPTKRRMCWVDYGAIPWGYKSMVYKCTWVFCSFENIYQNNQHSHIHTIHKNRLVISSSPHQS